jgi:hypothetical protein
MKFHICRRSFVVPRLTLSAQLCWSVLASLSLVAGSASRLLGQRTTRINAAAGMDLLGDSPPGQSPAIYWQIGIDRFVGRKGIELHLAFVDIQRHATRADTAADVSILGGRVAVSMVIWPGAWKWYVSFGLGGYRVASNRRVAVDTLRAFTEYSSALEFGVGTRHRVGKIDLGFEGRLLQLRNQGLTRRSTVIASAVVWY